MSMVVVVNPGKNGAKVYGPFRDQSSATKSVIGKVNPHDTVFVYNLIDPLASSKEVCLEVNDGSHQLSLFVHSFSAERVESLRAVNILGTTSKYSIAVRKVDNGYILYGKAKSLVDFTLGELVEKS